MTPPPAKHTWGNHSVMEIRKSIVSQALIGLLFVSSFTGCLGYRAGSGSLYAPDIQTVYVPIISSDSFRRDLGERLTEAVVKEIELKTPYKVVASPNADSILDIRLLGDSRTALAEDEFDNPRVFENRLRAQVSWQNRRHLPMAPPQTFDLPAGFTGDLVGVDQTTPLILEAGQTIASQQQLAIQRLAEQIVATMETPW